MKQEHIVHFKVIRDGEVKKLRGLIRLEPGKEPTIAQFAQCLRECGHEVILVDERRVIFEGRRGGNDYMIDVLEDYYVNTRDRDAEQLAAAFQKPDPVL
ncbi:hypothetical protein [Paenibacillus daejeonensis]|uniref:hypothetical protein n=1 Tax=Paenibacillus daejeonensis TaxID=135193 RepID=UPI0003730550|nr:hypothetical protein [Paenibacillus daejeonensis]